MTSDLTSAECLERARMHEQLAGATDDASARKMHQAMAAEFRRRAETGLSASTPVNRPILELVSNPV
ncbi:hypothetical protein DM806_15235 [Sphingobium lactosutens]|uniref:hypothetical protein n=1 Tax=Sphingobium lactosutens TaxID=522773 RepID=UPI0015B79C07|nr:hypothetical protein [Sphingobium lactosutens]NWK96994.1 hypothetical protein [Sphingobium lactosutens]